MSKSLFSVIRRLGIEVADPTFLELASIIVRHVVNAEDAYLCQRQLKESFDFSTVGTSAQQFRLDLADVSYVQYNLKFFALHIIKNGMRQSVLDRFDQFHVVRNDVVLLKKILGARGVRSELNRCAKIEPLTKQMVSVAAFYEASDVFERIHPDLTKYIRGRVYTKLRFISVSSNMEFYDLQMDLMCKAIQTFIKLVPTEQPEAYILNYIRRALANHTTNIIKSHTTQKRKRMVQGAADGFGGHTYEIPVLSENQLMKTFGIENLNYEAMQDVGVNGEEASRREDELNFESVLRRFGKTRKRRAFIKLVAGVESPQFTEYLISQQLINEEQDNVDFNDKVKADKYIDTVCSFLSIRRWKADKFLNHLAETAYPEHATA